MYQFFSPALAHMPHGHLLSWSALRVDDLLYEDAGVSSKFNVNCSLALLTEALSRVLVDAYRFRSLNHLSKNIEEYQEVLGVLVETERLVRMLQRLLPTSRLRDTLQRFDGTGYVVLGEDRAIAQGSNQISFTDTSEGSKIDVRRLRTTADYLCAHNLFLMDAVARLAGDIVARDSWRSWLASELWRRVDPVHGCLMAVTHAAMQILRATGALSAFSTACIAAVFVIACAALGEHVDSRDPKHGRRAIIENSSPLGSELKELMKDLLLAYVELDAVLLLVMEAETGTRTLSPDECRGIITFYESFNDKFTPLSHDMSIGKALDDVTSRNVRQHPDLGAKRAAIFARITTRPLLVDPQERQAGNFLLDQWKASAEAAQATRSARKKRQVVYLQRIACVLLSALAACSMLLTLFRYSSQDAGS